MCSPKVIDCEALRARGLWTGACCPSCHSNRWCEDDAFEVDLGDGSRLVLCCASGSSALLSGSDFAQLRQADAVSQAR